MPAAGVEVALLAVVPEPESANFTGEDRVELPMDNVPETLPLPVGRNASLNSKVWPGASETPEERPVVENAECERAAELIVRGTFPVFLRFTV